MTGRRHDGGFTLVELLAVMTIVSILTAIAVTVFASAREKAVDTLTRSDARNVGGMLAAAWKVPGVTRVSLNTTGRDRYRIQSYKYNYLLHEEVFFGAEGVSQWNNATFFESPSSWCVTLVPFDDLSRPIPGREYHYDAGYGVASGSCRCPVESQTRTSRGTCA